jgi:hypothetical protein
MAERRQGSAPSYEPEEDEMSGGTGYDSFDTTVD